MQSSLWKLLTAAGIIGIGSLFVLEVQHRLLLPGAERKPTTEAVAAEASVTADSSTGFDEFPQQTDPAEFDKSGNPGGLPILPAGADERFFADAVDRTVHKDNLSDESSPFDMAEPAVGEDSESSLQLIAPQPDPVNTGIQPARFQIVDSESPQASAETSFSGPEEDPVASFPLEDSESASNPATTRTQTSSGTAQPLPDRSRTAMTFFPQSGNGAAVSSPNPVDTSATAQSFAIESAPVNSTSAAALPAKTAARDGSDLASGDEVPEMFLPEPVPDPTGQPASSPADSNDPPSFDPLPFQPDGTDPSETTPARPNPLPRRERLPIRRNPVDEKNPDFFEPSESSPLAPAPEEQQSGDEPFESLPFTEDEPTGTRGENGSFPGSPSGTTPVPSPERSPRSLPEPPRRLDPEPFSDTDSSESASPGVLPLPEATDFPGAPPDAARRDLLPRDNHVLRDDVPEVIRPKLTIQKRAPDTATVGVSHDYAIVVNNEGDSAAYDVVVEDELGGAAGFVEARPLAVYDRSTGRLTWDFDEIPAGEKKEITVRIRPTGEGTLDGVATVRFKAQVRTATLITSPKLELVLTGPDQVKVGDEVPLQYTIRNRGTGDARNVILRSVLPPGLKHPEGGDLEYEIELLSAGSREDIDLNVVAAEPGDRVLVAAEVTASGVSAGTARTEIEIVGAQLTLERHGPERRFVGRAATYQNIVTNESKFEAQNAVVTEELPEGMRFVSASDGGKYNPDNRRISWIIPRLAPGKQAVLEVELVAETAGQMETMVEVTEEAGFRTPLAENTIVTVEDLHNVTAGISRQDEPVAIGERFGFTVTIDNRGTAVAKNVEMSVQVPAEIRVLAAGTRQVAGRLLAGNVVKYNTVLEIPPNESMTFQLTLQGEKPVRNAKVQAFLKYDEMPEPLIVSESVTVFDDRP